jgi:hypothetical protein
MRLIILLSLLLLNYQGKADVTLVGVLEEPQCAKENKKIAARVMFVKIDSEWHKLNSDETNLSEQIENQKWNITLDGKSLGTLTLTDPAPNSPKISDWYFARDKLYTPEGKAPSVNNPHKLFLGWCGAPSKYPLVIITKKITSTSAVWKTFVPEFKYKQKLYQPLKLVLGRTNTFNCRDSSDTKGFPYRFKPEDLKLFRGYRSKTGDELVSIGLDDAKYGCDGLQDSTWSQHFFLINGYAIDFIGNQMELVDSGDYDGDGLTDFLFWYSGYNEDGYVLVFDDLRQKVEYTWKYH